MVPVNNPVLSVVGDGEEAAGVSELRVGALED